MENLTQAKSLFHNLEVTSCVRDTEVSSTYIFERRIPTCNTSVKSNNREIIYININSVQIFIKLLFRYLTLRFLGIKTRESTEELGGL